MGIFMGSRTKLLALQVISAWGFARSPWISNMLWLSAAGHAIWYMWLLWKTLKAVDLKHVVWGIISHLVVLRDLTPQEFFRVDCPPEEVAVRREAALARLSAAWQKRWPMSQEKSKQMKKLFSDLRFKASGFESMFPVFQKVVNESLDMCTIVSHSEGTEIIDIDGQRLLDSSGSYGVNCFGHTLFKEFMNEGNKLAQKVGPCLGPMHPIVIDNIQMMLQIYRKEEVSFHMSGTEAVMCAVQQVRFHTGRPLIAVFKGAYHGWWDGVMQGAGNERFNSDCIVLKDRSLASLDLIKLRAHEIAGVIVNPISGVGWGNSTTANLGHAVVNAGPDAVERFRIWLCRIRETCTQSQVPLIFDETWAFQLGPGGAQATYGVEADVVTLGKALGGGHAVGAVCGPSWLMERRDPERPMRVSFVVGTFKGSPMVMGSMNAVLKWVTQPDAEKVFNDHKARVAKWVESCNALLKKENLPISVAAYRNMWCVCYTQRSAYHFLFHCYLRDAGLQMVWVGTGKMLLNLEFKDDDFSRLTSILVSAAKAFKLDGWWWEGGKEVQLMKYVLGPTVKFHSNRFRRRLGFGFGFGI